MQLPQFTPRPQSVLKTGAGADLAFAVVLLASYFATFSSLTEANPIEIVLMVTLGILYIFFGIYGYAFVARSNSFVLRLLYFVIQAPLGGWIVYMSKGGAFNILVLLPLAGQSVMLFSNNWMVAVNGVILGAYMVTAGIINGGWESLFQQLPTFLAGQVFIVVFTQMAVSQEKSRMEVERLVTELAEANQQLREYALEVEELAITRERNRLAREIHDGLGHYLTTIHMQIRAARAIAASEPAHALEIMATAQNLTQQALSDVRSSVSALRTRDGEGLSLDQRIQRVVDNASVAGSNLEFRVEGPLRQLSPQADLTLYRTAQEGVNNACKHARAEHIRISLNYTDPAWVRLRVEDDGIGTEQLDGGFGLMGIKERVHLLNGEVRITSLPGQGFLLEVGVPE